MNGVAMKIDRSNPVHWLRLALFGLNVLGAMLCRPFRRRGCGREVVLYGHKLAGNLLAIYRHLQDEKSRDTDVYFLTMDKAYHRDLAASGIRSVLATRPAALALMSRMDAVISDHGLHAMAPMLSLSDVKFFDVWHGIPFKGFDADDFRLQHRYDEVWLPSLLLKDMYVERFGFAAQKLEVTGYARTDCLIKPQESARQIRHKLGLDSADTGKIVLFAPTWKQDAQNRSIYPFGVDEHSFFQRLSGLAHDTHATFVMRAHLNSGAMAGTDWDRIVQRPHATWPDTEQLLQISDILVCDWSSIAFDYLLLQRPTIFLDVEAPFAKGFSLGPEYRFGKIVPDMDTLLAALEHYLRQPNCYQAEYGAKARNIREKVYGDFADGRSTQRCVQRLKQRL